MKCIKEDLDRILEVEPKSVEALDPVMADAKITQDKIKDKLDDVFNAEKLVKAEPITGHNKKDYPKEVEMPKIELDESLFDEANSFTDLRREQELDKEYNAVKSFKKPVKDFGQYMGGYNDSLVTTKNGNIFVKHASLNKAEALKMAKRIMALANSLDESLNEAKKLGTIDDGGNALLPIVSKILNKNRMLAGIVQLSNNDPKIKVNVDKLISFINWDDAYRQSWDKLSDLVSAGLVKWNGGKTCNLLKAIDNNTSIVNESLNEAMSQYANTNMSKYWLNVDGKSVFEGIANDDFAFNKILDYMSKNEIKDKNSLDIGIIWLNDDGSDGDWAIWCNPGEDEEAGDLDQRISGNDEDYIELLREYFTTGGLVELDDTEFESLDESKNDIEIGNINIDKVEVETDDDHEFHKPEGMDAALAKLSKEQRECVDNYAKTFKENLNEDFAEVPELVATNPDNNDIFIILGYCANAMKECGIEDEIDSMYHNALAGDYNNMCDVCGEYTNKCNDLCNEYDDEFEYEPETKDIDELEDPDFYTELINLR